MAKKVEGSFSVKLNKQFALKDWAKGFRAAAEFALERVAERLLADSRLYVPVLTGALRDSGIVEQTPSIGDAVATLRVRYNMPYAEIQHERPFNHPSLGFFGAARYLAIPLELYGRYYLELYRFECEEFIRRNGLGT
jgi:hypothetical protein